MEINLTAPSQVRALLSRYRVFPKKRFGQNFLVDRNTLERLVASLHLEPEDVVLEVGAGIGTATRELAQRAGKVVAVELDQDLIPVLHETLSDCPNVEILQADFLKLDLAQVIGERSPDGKAKIFANLPYYITSPIITRLVDERAHLNCAVLMVQREVADRLLAKPATSDYSSLTVLVNFYMQLDLVMRVSRKVFLPPPEVDSSGLSMTPLPSPAVRVEDDKLFFHVVHAAFGKRRKTLENALAGAPGIRLGKPQLVEAFKRVGIDPSRRGETLSLEEFARLTDSISEGAE